jgi:hypothetical protein
MSFSLFSKENIDEKKIWDSFGDALIKNKLI